VLSGEDQVEQEVAHPFLYDVHVLERSL